jgi:hypothetical protein
MATQISSCFQIVTDLAAGQTTTNLATSRSMRVVSIHGTGVDNAVITVSKVSSGGVATQVGVCTIENAAGGGSDTLNDQPAVMDALANCTLVATDTLRIVRSVANSTRIVMTCVADSGQAVTES